MDVSNYKEVIRGLFKSYSSLLVPVVIGLVGVLLFIPTRLMNSRLKEGMEAGSVLNGNIIQDLLNRDTVVSGQWEKERHYRQAQERDANQIALLAEQSAQRMLLSYTMFPEPKDTSTLIFEEGFGREFRRAIDGLLSRINARDCPTEAELEGIKRRWGVKNKSRGSKSKEVDTTIVDDLCRGVAKSACVYANKTSLSGYKFWQEYEYLGWKEALEDCWYSQLGYWILEDVVDTISVVNSASESVFTSKVKRLLSVNFPKSKKKVRSKYTSTSSSRGKKAGDRPSYILSSSKEELKKSCTGRISKGDIDVVHFNVSVLVSTRAVLLFMRELCSAKEHNFNGWDGEDDPPQIFKHNQITILQYKIAPIEREDEMHELYRYGDDAVAQLDLTCEYIFDKKGYDKIKPDAVKKAVEEDLKELEKIKAKKKKGVKKGPKPKVTEEELLNI